MPLEALLLCLVPGGACGSYDYGERHIEVGESRLEGG
jgi:hypothetical protein